MIKFGLKIGAITTPGELSNVFQYAFMKYQLGIWLEHPNVYKMNFENGGVASVKADTPIVYLGFCTWRLK